MALVLMPAAPTSEQEAHSAAAGTQRLPCVHMRSLASSAEGDRIKTQSVVLATSPVSAMDVTALQEQRTHSEFTIEGRGLEDVSVRAAAEHGYEGVYKQNHPQPGLKVAAVGQQMVSHLNQLQAFMQKVVRCERTRHTSEVSLLMRRTGKDLQETYHAIQESMNTLTTQVMDLCSDMESAQRQVRDIKQKYLVVKQEAEIQNQYISELEAVLDGNGGAGTADTLRKHIDALAAQRKEYARALKDAGKREGAMQAEVAELRKKLQGAKDAIGHLSKGPGTVALPEMAPSWTRKAVTCESSSSSHTATVGGESSASFNRLTPRLPCGLPEEADGVSNAMFGGTIRRGVSRLKPVRRLIPSPRDQLAPLSQRMEAAGQPAARHAVSEEAAEERIRSLEYRLRKTEELARSAEERAERRRGLLDFAATSLRLLKAIFGELHTNWRLQAEGVEVGEEMVGKAPKVLDRIVTLFCEAIPGMGDLTELIQALTEELSRIPPSRSREPTAGGDTIDSMHDTSYEDILSPDTSFFEPAQET